MENIEDQILLCIEWLDKQKVIKTINRSRTSIHYIRIIKKWSGIYVSEEAFIEAVKLKNIPYHEEKWKGLSIFVSLSEKDVKRYEDKWVKIGRYNIRMVKVEGLKR